MCDQLVVAVLCIFTTVLYALPWFTKNLSFVKEWCVKFCAIYSHFHTHCKKCNITMRNHLGQCRFSIQIKSCFHGCFRIVLLPCGQTLLLFIMTSDWAHTYRFRAWWRYLVPLKICGDLCKRGPVHFWPSFVEPKLNV